MCTWSMTTRVQSQSCSQRERNRKSVDRRTYVRIEHVFEWSPVSSFPGFELRAALRARPRLALVPAALAPGGGGRAAPRAGDRGRRGGGSEAGDAPRRGACDVPVARPRRSRPGGGRAGVGGRLATPRGMGLAVDPVEQGAVVFETRGVERLYGGVQPALERALAAVGPAWDPRIGAADRRFTALAAASVARPVRSSSSRRRRKRRSSSRCRSRCSP